MARRKRTPRTGTCIYCGVLGKVTDDHVPPKTIFAQPRPNNLITVPACRKCNESFSKDDEYFRLKLGTNDAARGNSDINRNLPGIMKSLQRREAKGLAQAFLRDLIPVDVQTQSGILLGSSYAYNVNLNRIARVIKRTVRGLFYHERKERVPDDHDIAVVFEEDLREENPIVVQQFVDTIMAPLRAAPPTVIGEDTFAYRYALTDRPPTSAWWLSFYGSMHFVAMLSPATQNHI